MHGHRLAEEVLAKIKASGSPAKKFKVLVGESLALSEVELREALAAKTDLGFVIETVPLKAACYKCSTEFSPAEFTLSCPKCGGLDFKIVSGLGIEVFPLSEV